MAKCHYMGVRESRKCYYCDAELNTDETEEAAEECNQNILFYRGSNLGWDEINKHVIIDMEEALPPYNTCNKDYLGWEKEVIDMKKNKLIRYSAKLSGQMKELNAFRVELNAQHEQEMQNEMNEFELSGDDDDYDESSQGNDSSVQVVPPPQKPPRKSTPRRKEKKKSNNEMDLFDTSSDESMDADTPLRGSNKNRKYNRLFMNASTSCSASSTFPNCTSSTPLNRADKQPSDCSISSSSEEESMSEKRKRKKLPKMRKHHNFKKRK